MNYAALIENRKSVRAFRSKEASASDLQEIGSFYENSCHRLLPELHTELMILDTASGKPLVGAAGYQDELVGAPHYLVLLSEPHRLSKENAGYIMEDLILKLTDMELSSCWITYADGDKVKKALGLNTPLEIAAIAAFGYGEKTQKKLRLNILSMSCVDIIAQRGYYAQKKDVNELVYVDQMNHTKGLDERIGFYEDMLWQSFYAVSRTPSFLNRQPYAFILKDQDVVLVRMADPYTDDASAGLNLGIAMLHFSVIAEQWVGKICWDLAPELPLELPEGDSVAAVYHM